MTISASNVAPDFLSRRSLHADDLKELQEPAVIFEHHGIDDDGAHFYVYTVAGWLNGENIATSQGGATVGGDVIVIHADRREDADEMACLGLQTTIDSLHQEQEKMIDALAAKARLDTIGSIDRMDLAVRDDKSEKFEEDMAKVRTLAGDDIILASGH